MIQTGLLGTLTFGLIGQHRDDNLSLLIKHGSEHSGWFSES